jgi:hypothetical protein
VPWTPHVLKRDSQTVGNIVKRWNGSVWVPHRVFRWMPAVDESLWPDSETPPEAGDVSAADGLTLGTRIHFAVAGQVTALRYYESANLDGAVELKLWNGGTNTQVAVVAAPTAVAGSAGWRTVALPTSVGVSASPAWYVVSYHLVDTNYSAQASYFTSARVVGNLTAPASADVSGGNGLYTYEGGHTRPSSNFNASCYFADVVFRTT